MQVTKGHFTAHQSKSLVLHVAGIEDARFRV